MDDEILKKIDRLANPSFLKHIRRLENTLPVISNQSAIDKAMISFATQQSAIDKVMATFIRPSAIDKAMASFATQQSATDKVMASFTRPSAIDKAMASFATQQSAIDKAMATFARPSATDKAIASISTQQSAIDKAMATFVRPSTIDKAIASFAMQHSTIEKMIGSFTLQQSVIEKTVSSFAKSSSLLVGEPNYLSELARIVSAVDMSTLDASSFEYELEQSCSQLDEVDGGKSLINVFSNLPPLVQAIFYYLLINVFLAQVNSISANLLTPIVENYLESVVASDRDKVKGIKKIPLSLGHVDTDGLRFITGNNVRLRIKPSTNSEIIDELVLGQVVTVLSKNRNWIEVMYEYEDGKSISGWVFTRYTANFVQ
ncbi:MAG: hypothetical protein ACI86C_001531 [Candidatus Latescibacterota bacterium]|jgi:hypothetical protein